MSVQYIVYLWIGIEELHSGVVGWEDVPVAVLGTVAATTGK